MGRAVGCGVVGDTVGAGDGTAVGAPEGSMVGKAVGGVAVAGGGRLPHTKAKVTYSRSKSALRIIPDFSWRHIARSVISLLPPKPFIAT